MEEVRNGIVHFGQIRRGHHCVPVQGARSIRHRGFREGIDQAVWNLGPRLVDFSPEGPVDVLSDPLHRNYLHQIQGTLLRAGRQHLYMRRWDLSNASPSGCLQNFHYFLQENRKAQTSALCRSGEDSARE